MKLELFNTEEEIKFAEDGLFKLEVQYISGNYYKLYNLEQEIKVAKERIRQSKNKLLK